MSVGNPPRGDRPHLRPTGPATPGPVRSFVLFVLMGGGVTVLSAMLLSAYGMVSDVPARLLAVNALITAGGTVLATELHRRVTFRSDRRGFRMHAESALTAFGAFLATSAAMLVLRAFNPDPSVLLDQGVYLAASAVAGGIRFVVLRLVVFSCRPGSAERRGRGEREAVALAA
ncbi:hypothetical protein LO762_17870 [Actinocorallia sp. API 0066]|uniref:hypothetical protein n=1 Tax=Actinocorallia sp. API 0066 TaxID=2896846 RepID=UPI001E4217AC|nr:hypothetical protein [Actinocorallia sp. API 0066]MCD0451051.1 hypothetical protein [Actinocorallia sp. API 0066]